VRKLNNPKMILRILTTSLLFTSSLSAPIGAITHWNCNTLSSSSLATGALWEKLVCNGTGVPLFGSSENIVVNVVTGDLSPTTKLRLVPGVAAKGPSGFNLDSLDKIVAANQPTSGTNLAAINGGYFYRLDVKTFFDGVCIGKNSNEASQAPSLTAPNNGINDGTIVIGGQLHGSNCDCVGYSRPVVFTLNGTSSHFDVLTRGAEPPSGLTLDAVSSSPNLVSTNASGSYVDIPSDDDNLGNILEHSANTGVCLRPSLDGNSVEVVMLTIDGYDGCSSFNSTCGTNAFSMAYFLKDYFNCTSGMNMDQGGSTTMYVKGQPNNGIVSSSGGGPRAIASGLILVGP
jgi:hypothetical protein